MNCSIRGCPGTYEARTITHTVQRGADILVVERVPAEVCSTCGDTLLAPATIGHLETLLSSKRPVARLIPLFEYA